MEETALIKVFKRLSQGSKQAVQNGSTLDDFDRYLHVERPIEKAVRKAMDEIRIQGGGILLLVGNAGDGKSHIIATLKKDYPDFLFHNDASESLSSTLTALDTLKIHLQDMDDEHLYVTNKKVVVNINLGKLSEFIDDDEVKDRFSEISKCAVTLFDEDNLRHDQTERVRIVSFGNHQIFELYPDKDNCEYPVDSNFIKTILHKITASTEDNLFYAAYLESKPINDSYDPVQINYQLLGIPEIQDSVVKLIIEAVVRFKLVITPRELFDCIYRLVVPERINDFQVNKNFFSCLLPTILFEDSENRILKCISQLDPLKFGCLTHNDKLSQLFTSIEIPDWANLLKLNNKIDQNFFNVLNEFYHNNRSNVEDISKLLLRLDHLLDYHSESVEYVEFLKILCGYYANDPSRLFPLYEMIMKSIPHYYGSYTDHNQIVPLNIQGRNYKMFVGCETLKPLNKMDVPFNKENRNEFVIEIDTFWKMTSNLPSLKVDFQLFAHLSDICKGKLTLASDREHNLTFTQFISNIVEQTDYQEKLIILTPDNQQLILSKNFGNNLTLR